MQLKLRFKSDCVENGFSQVDSNDLIQPLCLVHFFHISGSKSA